MQRSLDYIKSRLLELCLPTERHIVMSKYDLEEVCKMNTQKMIKNVWDNKFIGNRHVVVTSELSAA